MNALPSQHAAWNRINQAKVQQQINNDNSLGSLSRRAVELLDKKLIIGELLTAGIDCDKKKKTATLTITFSYSPY